MAHHRVQQSQQQTNTFSVGLSAEVNHDGEPLEAAAAFSPHGHHHGLHSLYSSGFLRKPRKIGRNLPNDLRFTKGVFFSESEIRFSNLLISQKNYSKKLS